MTVTLAGVSAFAQAPIGEGVQAQLTYEIAPLSDAAHAVHPNEPLSSLTLDAAVTRALEVATFVQKAKNDLDLTGEQLIQGYAQFLPNLQAGAGYSRIEGNSYLTTAQPTTLDTRNRGASYQVSTTLNIFNGFGDLANFRASLARKRGSEFSLTRAKQLIALDVAQTYLQVVLDRHIVTIATKNLASSQAREQLFTEQARVGIRNLADLYRQQAQTSSDESYLVSSQDKQRQDELLLLRKLRLETSGRFEFAEPTLEAPASPDPKYSHEADLIDQAISARPDLAAQNEYSRAFHFDITNARSTYWPKLDFGLSATGGGRELESQLVNGVDVTSPAGPSINDQLHNDVVWTAGLTLTWSIFDRWLTTTNVERAVVNSRNSNLDLEDLRLQVIAEVRQAYGDYHTVLQQLQSSGKGLTAAQKAFETVEARYKVGSASFIDLVTAQATLVQADAARSQALIGYALQSRVLETVLGR